jgi:hypothetical protein
VLAVHTVALATFISGPQAIDKNQPIRLAEFSARTQKYSGVPARITYSKDPDVAGDKYVQYKSRYTTNFYLLLLEPNLALTNI